MEEHAPRDRSGRLITVFGGSGFLGRHVVAALARRGYRVRAAVRRPDLTVHLQPLGNVGQIHALQANLRFPETVRHALRAADAAVNLVGILQESGRQTFSSVLTEGAGCVAAEAARAGIPVVHVSAIGADPNSPALYGRAKAEGEARVFAAAPDAVIMRPSILFGPGDSFFNRFGALARAMPVLPLAGAQTRFQPAYVADMAEAVARAVDGGVAGGRIYELGGPEIFTFRELVEYVLETTGRRRAVVALPPSLAMAQATVTEFLDKISFGLMPDEFVLTRDQVAMLGADNVVSPEAIAERRTFAGIGIEPTGIRGIVPAYLQRFRRRGQFDSARTRAA